MGFQYMHVAWMHEYIYTHCPKLSYVTYRNFHGGCESECATEDNPGCCDKETTLWWTYLVPWLWWWYIMLCACSFASVCLTLCALVACQAPLPMRFSRQEYWSGLPCPSPGDLLDPGFEPTCPVAPALQADFSPLSHWEMIWYYVLCMNMPISIKTYALCTVFSYPLYLNKDLKINLKIQRDSREVYFSLVGPFMWFF